VKLRRGVDEERFPADRPMGEALLEVRDLRTHFATGRGTVRAVDGVTFSLQRGKTLGVVGESGSGKTVLSRSIMGLLPRQNVTRTGSISYRGVELVGLDAKEMRLVWGTEMAMVFQDPLTALNPVVKVGRQLNEALQFHLEMDKPEATETSIALLRSVGIPEPERRLEQYPFELSGGMRQRVIIAIALSCGPKLLFADEPTTALDVTVQAQILNLLAEKQQERHMAMILVTHDLGVVAGRTDEIAVMYAGKIVEKAPTARLFSEMRMPYTEALVRSIPRMERPAHTRLTAITGRPPDLAHPPVGCNFAPRCAYAQERCLTEEPPLQLGDKPDHLFACWYPAGTPDGKAAFEANLAAGRPQTLAAMGQTAQDVDVELTAAP
jgi:peptide/nickel transport system ATP-binding protein